MNNSPNAVDPGAAGLAGDHPDKTAAHYVPSKIEWGLAGLSLVLLLLWSVRIVDPVFLDGQLLPCMALAFLPGGLLTLLRRRAVQMHRAGFAAGLIVFLIWNGTISKEELINTATNWRLVVPGIILYSLQLMIGTLRWQLLLRGQRIFIHYLTLLRLLFIGSFFNTFIPGSTGCDVYRAYRVSQESHVSTAAVTASVIIDRFAGLPAMLTLILTGVLLNLDFVNAHAEFRHLVHTIGWVFGILAVAVAGIFLASIFLQERVQKLEGRLPGGVILSRLTKAIAVYKSHPLLLLEVFVISIVAHLTTLGAFLFFARATGVQGVAYSQYLFLVFAGLATNFLPLAPGGAGQGEAAFSWIFDLAAPGLGNGPRAASMMICCRVGMLLCGIVGGIIYSLGKEHIHFSQPPQPAENPESVPVSSASPAISSIRQED